MQIPSIKSPRRLAFIGAGNMSRAIISGLQKHGYPAELISASNPSLPKLTALNTEFGIETSQNNADVIKQADVVVLAVKPQLMQAVCADFLPSVTLDDKLVVSIAAGIPVKRLSEMLGGHTNIVRTMPNTPSQLGLGMTGIYAPDSVEQDDVEFVEQLMQQVGRTLTVSEEQQIDAIIATAGSSPAYFFRLLEAMQTQAVQMGFTQKDARLLVQQAMLGAAEMVCHNSELEISQLRAQVTSKGGTTAKAVESLEAHGIDTMLADAMQAAVKRANEMAEQF